MTKNLTANQLAGRAAGALFFALFGALWLGLGFYAREELRTAILCGLGMGLGILILLALYLRRQARRWPRLPDDPAVGRAFHRINALQWIAVAVTAYLFSRLHLQAYVLSAITVIVGLHLLPLARIFHYRPHLWAGSALVLWAVASAIATPAERLQGVTALGTGTLLWMSAACTLVLALRTAAQPQSVAA